MSGLISFLLGAAILTTIYLLCTVVLWLAFGRKKRGEEKAIGLLEYMAHFRASNMVDHMQRRIR